MTARLGQITLILTIVAVGYFIYASVQGSIKSGLTIKNTDSGLETGLVAHWTFDGPDMISNVADVSGRGNHGVLLNFTATTTVAGKLGQALDFEQSASEYVRISNDSGDLDPGAGDFSVSFWYQGPFTSGNFIADDYDTSDGLWEIGMSAGAGRYYFTGAAFDGYSFGNFALPNDSGWHHVVFRLDRSTNPDTYSAYVDGESVAITAQTNTTNDQSIVSSWVGIGKAGFFAASYRDTPMDDVRIYNRLLSSDEITQLYNMSAGNKMGKTITSSGLQSGLTGHWTFDGPDTTSATATDMSGYNRDGVLWNGPTIGPGKVGQALFFDGTDDHVRVGSLASNLITANDGSISLWFKPEGSAISRTYVWNLPTVLGDFGGYFGIHRGIIGGQDRIWVYNYDGAEDQIGMTYNVGEWIHVTWVHTGGVLSAYKNGVFVASTTSSITELLSAFVRIGDGFGDYIQGGIDDVRTYERALSADEVTELYNMGAGNKAAKTITPTGLASGLVGHWTFDGPNVDLSSTTAEVLDSSANANHGDLIDASPRVTVGRVGQAMSFAKDRYINVPSNVLDLISVSTGAISLWMRPTISSGDLTLSQMLYGRQAVGPNQIFPAFGITAANNTDYGGEKIWVWNETAVGTYQAAGVDYTLNEWTHIVWQHANGTLSIYKNGELASSTTSGNTYSSGMGTFLIGNNWLALSGNGRKFAGDLDDVRVYNRELSADEVRQLYNMGR